MVDRTFRFGVVAAPTAGAQAWRDSARRIEQLGYQVLVTPDDLLLPAPTVSSAVAASVTSTPRVGDGHPGDAPAGRGTRPALPTRAGTPGRLDAVEQTVTRLRSLETDTRTPVLIAAGGPGPERSPPPTRIS